MHPAISSADLDEAVNWRRHLHAHPELAFEEHATSQFVAEQLGSWGIQVRRGYGRTGLVGTISRGSSRKAIAVRADMDALPILEQTGALYRSTVTGKMHACGHDGHVAMALAAARAATRLHFDGTVHFIFQPAEEAEGGGRQMIADGLFRDFDVDEIYALHNWPALDIGQCVARDAEMMAALGTFEIAIAGRGSHGAMPHEGADPIVAASQIVSALQTIASRNVSPLDSAVVSVTQFHAGDAWNAIPQDVVIRGTTRWFDKAVGAKIEARMIALSEAIASGFDCTATVDHVARYPATINNATCAENVRSVAGRADVGLSLIDAAPSMAAEDFAFMLQQKPGCYVWLGARKDGENPGLHSPRYDLNDDLLPIGSSFWAHLTEARLRA